MEENNFGKVKAPIIGADGNVFNLIGICKRQLNKAGFESEAKEMANRVMNCGSYDEALVIMQEYVIPTSVNDFDEEM